MEAEGYGRADLYGFSRKSIVNDIGKYVHFDNAKQSVKQLGRYVDEFQKELSDVCADIQVNVEMDGFTRFADWFFDGIFADLAALRRIEESRSSVREARIKMERILGRLEEMKRELQRQIRELQRALYTIAESA